MNPAKAYGSMFAGIIAGIVSDLGHHYFPTIADQNIFFSIFCVTIGAIAYPTGLFLALMGLFGEAVQPRAFILPALLCLFFTVGSLGGGVEKLVTLIMLNDFAQDVSGEFISKPPTIAPQSGFSDEQRSKIAADIYARTSYLTAYRVQDGKLVYFQPSDDEVAKRNSFIDSKRQLIESTADVQKKLRTNTHLVLLYFGIRASAFFLVFLGGILWVGLRRQSATILWEMR